MEENRNWHLLQGKKDKGKIRRNTSREKLVMLLVGGLLRGSGMKDRNLQAVKLH